MGAIKIHKTAVDTKGGWDGPKAVAEALAEVVMLNHMHAWVEGKGDPEKKSSYKFPHHLPGTDTPAVIKGVNNALARLPQANIPAGDKTGVEAHLRAHRKAAGLQEAMSEAEINEAVKFVKDVDDLKAVESQALLETVRLQEKSNLGEWLESRLHLNLTQIADDLFGGGNVTRDERKALSGAIGAALDVYHQFLADNAPQLFDRRPWEDAPAPDGGTSLTAAQTPAGKLVLSEALQGEFIPLMEKAVGQDGTIPVKIIQPGWGSSGYYSKEILARDGAQAFPIGTKMFWNHPTRTEESDRPERDLNDLAAELVSAPQFQEKGPKGPGLYAKAKVFQSYQPAVDEMAGSIGVSIRADGVRISGTAEGREGLIVSKLLPNEMNTVDFVTYPGAGGEVVSLFEAARMDRADNQPATQRGVENHEEVDMTEEDKRKLEEANAALLKENGETKAENARLQEALILREATDLVGTVLAKSALPDVTKTRLVASLAKAAPVKDGKLDKEAFATQIAEAVKAEVKYLTEAAGLGKITGLGESAESEEGDGNEKLQESLEQSFTAIGLSETAAKKAAKGRG